MVGVDEVGRGCLAGPLLVVAAKATAELPEGVKDSKQLTKKQRERILNKLSICCKFGEGWVQASEIDEFGLAGALKLGVERALSNLDASADEEIVLDGVVNYIPKGYTSGRCQIDADADVPIVSAASIYAKVRRDDFMANLSKKHPAYKFESNVGYGTAEHYKAIERLGPIDAIHRLSFQPFRQLSLL